MKLTNRTLDLLADVVCGGVPNSTDTTFPYRSSTYLTQFFTYCDMEYIHRGESRKWWVLDVLTKLNEGSATDPSLPPDGIQRVIKEVFADNGFASGTHNIADALRKINLFLKRESLEVYLDSADNSHIRNTGTGSTSAGKTLAAPTWSKEELAKRAVLTKFLDGCSEDQMIEKVLVPMFSQIGFQRVTSAGHKDKSLEYGKDLWMKFRLPTGHFLYFAIQAKKDKLDSAGIGKHTNITEIKNQVQMALSHPIFDSDVNQKVLVDHVFVVCGGEITKQARNLLGGQLDQEARRQTIFMDREELLNVGCRLNLELSSKKFDGLSDIPF
jgi:hypothetical protein